MTYNEFCEEKFENLNYYEKLRMYNEYADRNHYPHVYDFNDDNVNLVFKSPWAAVQVFGQSSAFPVAFYVNDCNIVYKFDEVEDFEEFILGEDFNLAEEMDLEEEWLERLYDILDETFKLWEDREVFFDDFFENSDVTEIDDDDVVGDFEEFVEDNHNVDIPSF